MACQATAPGGGPEGVSGVWGPSHFQLKSGMFRRAHTVLQAPDLAPHVDTNTREWEGSLVAGIFGTPPLTALTLNRFNRRTASSQPVSDSDPTLQTSGIYCEGLKTRFVDANGKERASVQSVVGGLARLRISRQAGPALHLMPGRHFTHAGPPRRGGFH